MKKLLITTTLLISFFLADAQIMFKRELGTDTLDLPYCVTQTTDGGYLIGGMTKTIGLTGNMSIDALIIKTDEYGDTLCTRVWGHDTIIGFNSQTEKCWGVM